MRTLRCAVAELERVRGEYYASATAVHLITTAATGPPPYARSNEMMKLPPLPGSILYLRRSAVASGSRLWRYHWPMDWPSRELSVDEEDYLNGCKDNYPLAVGGR